MQRAFARSIGMLIFLFFAEFAFGVNNDSCNNSEIVVNIELEQSTDIQIGTLLFINDSIINYSNELEPVSNFKKFIYQIKEGNYHYAFQRVYLAVKAFIYRIFNKKRKAFQSKKHFETLLFESKFSTPIGASIIQNEANVIKGNMLWVHDSLVLVDFIFSPFHIKDTISAWQKQNSLLSYFSTSYVNYKQRPVGFHLKNGIAINRKMNPFWDGLIFLQNGKVRVADYSSKRITSEVNNETGQCQAIDLLHPELCVMQLPLLIFNNELLFDPDKVPYKLRELRLLSKIKNKKSGDEYFVITNIYSPQFYPNILTQLLSNNKEFGFENRYTLLLDVGSNNLFKAYNPSNRIVTTYRSITPIEKANNVMVFTLTDSKSEYNIDLRF